MASHFGIKLQNDTKNCAQVWDKNDVKPMFYGPKYIIVPVCRDAHWWLLVVINQWQNSESNLKRPPYVFLKYDSIDGDHGFHEVVGQMVQYLKLRYVKLHWSMFDDRVALDDAARANMPAIAKFEEAMNSCESYIIRCPLQENAYDCGVYMLHTMDLVCAMVQREGFSYETHVRQDHSKWYIQADIDAKRHFLANMVLEIDTYVCDKGASEKFTLVRGCCEVIDPPVSQSVQEMLALFALLDRKEVAGEEGDADVDELPKDLDNCQTSPNSVDPQAPTDLMIQGIPHRLPDQYKGSLLYDQGEVTKLETFSKAQLESIGNGNAPGGKLKANDSKKVMIFKIIMGKWL